jgi:uncharacterized protein YjbI with pentapeptide repeats
VEIFDLQGIDVGSRTLAAIRRTAAKEAVVLNCAGAHFVTAVNLSNVTFVDADFTEAEFKHGLRLKGVTFTGESRFDRARSSDFFLDGATFTGNAGFRKLRAANLTVRNTAFERYVSFDSVILGFAGFRDVKFHAEARFRSIKRAGPIVMRSVRFAAAASFQDSVLRQISFPGCEFHGPLQTKKLEVDEELSFPGARFMDTRSLDLCAGLKVSLRDASFARPLAIAIESPELDATGACFEQGADIALKAGSRAAFSTAAFGEASLITTDGEQDGPPARIEELRGTRVGRLTLQSLDVSGCSFAHLHRLDDVLISGRGQLALAPRTIKGVYRREVLADELALRADPSGEEAQRASKIADVYRAMRKAREASHDYPGAADFYYGEMEMRRAAAGSRVERLILNLYWLLSGYGMRAGRAVVSYAVAVLLLAAGFQAFGFAQPSPFWHTVAWTLTASISLTRSTEAIDLTTAGMYLNVLTRLAGPALIGLAVLALRSRVRR